jgi:hypothetical protein
LANITTAAIGVLGLIALGLLCLPSSSPDYPTILVKAMLLVLVGLTVAMVRDGITSNGTRNRPSIRIFVLLGIEVLLVAAWALWFLDVHGLRQHFPAGRSLL